jgi:hypothetical protein
MRIIIDTIPHAQQRYATTGDWRFRRDNVECLEVLVSDMGDWRYEMLVGIHEAIEALLCKRDDVSEESVSAFDVNYEALREIRFPTGPNGEWQIKGSSRIHFSVPLDRLTPESEPGDDPAAPYHNQHCIAEGVTRILAPLLGVAWYDFEAANLALYADAAPR